MDRHDKYTYPKPNFSAPDVAPISCSKKQLAVSLIEQMFVDPSHERVWEDMIAPRFTEVELPPALPVQDILAATTLYIWDDQPCNTVNQVLSFLECQASASLKKINRKKYAVSADIFHEARLLNIKIRCYMVVPKKADNQCCVALEVQRRSGDIVAFNHSYHMMADYLKLHVATVENMPDTTNTGIAFPPLPTIDEPDLSCLQPLIDMANATDAPELQAEAAIAFRELAKNHENVSSLCSDRTLGCLKKLLDHNRVDIAFPAAQVVRILATIPDVASCLCDEEFMASVVQQVNSTSATSLVKRELMHTMGALAKCSDCVDSFWGGAAVVQSTPAVC